MVTVTKLTKATNKLVGMAVPKQQHGNIGRIVEQTMIDAGYVLDSSNAPDIPSIGVEIKSRIDRSTSAHTVGTMSITSINTTAWEDSSVCSKIQQQFRVKIDNKAQVITSAKMYDFRDQEIQRRLKYAYEISRAKINNILATQQQLPTYIRGKDAIAYWEHKSGDSYGFRISNAGMKIIETMSKNSKNFSNIFAYN